MRKEEVASALRYYLDQLHRADFEIKQGGDLEVIKGVDKRGEGDAIGQVMYGHGCPWRADPSNCRCVGGELRSTRTWAFRA
eukprot:3364326-Rhodomonas_salina.1